MKTIEAALELASLTLTKLVGGYGDDLSLKLKFGLLVANFRIDSYMNSGKRPVIS
jgi:hypothetical protein